MINNLQYAPSQALVKDQLNQIRLLSSEIQAKESESSLLKDELTRLSETCYSYQKQAESLETRYKFLLEEHELKSSLLLDEISSLKQQKNSLKTQNLELQQQILGVCRENNHLENDLEGFLKEKEYLEGSLNACKQDIYHCTLENEHLTSKLTQKNEVISKGEKEIFSLNSFTNSVSNELNSLKEEIKMKCIELSEKNATIGSLKRSLQDYEQLNQDYEALGVEFEEVRGLLEVKEEEVRELKEVINKGIKENDGDKNQYMGEIKALTEKYNNLNEKYLLKNEEIKALNEKIALEIEGKGIIEADLKSLILIIDTKKAKTVPNIDIKSKNLHLSVLKTKILELVQERDKVVKQSKKLTKNQQFLLEDVKNIHQKLLGLNSIAQNQENASFLGLKAQYEEKLNEIDRVYCEKENEWERELKGKEHDLGQLTGLLNEHIALIKQKEQEKTELLGILQINSPPINNNNNNNNIIQTSPIPNEMEEVKMDTYDLEITDFTNLISLLLQMLMTANEKYRDLLHMKSGFKMLLDYYLTMNSSLKDLDNNRIRHRTPLLRKFRKAGICVLFCEVLTKAWGVKRSKGGNIYNNNKGIRLDFKNFTYDHIVRLLPKEYCINDRLEGRVRELFREDFGFNERFNEIMKLLINPASRRIRAKSAFLSPEIISCDLKRLQVVSFHQKSHFLELNKENENKTVILFEENEYIKGKLNEVTHKLETMGLEYNTIRELLNDSENKRSILIQNFKELERHAQALNTENQIIKEERINHS